MIIEVAGKHVHASTGGVDIAAPDADPNTPVVILVHGAGMDSTVWQLQTRYLAYRNIRAIAVDLPGHGSSEGPALGSIDAIATWLCGFIDTLGWGPATVVGHSMGTFIAIEAAARRPELVNALVLMGTATAMGVHPELLRFATEDLPAAAALMAGWGHDTPARTGLNPTPGMWMTGGTQALIERSAPGVLATDLSACANYDAAASVAEALTTPTTVVIGLGDRMTPPASGRTMASLIAGATTVELAGTGHTMMFENPRAVRAAILAAVSGP